MRVDKDFFPDVGEATDINGVYSIIPYIGINRKIPDSAALCTTNGQSSLDKILQVIPSGGSAVIHTTNNRNRGTKIYLIKGHIAEAGELGDYYKYYYNGKARWGWDVTDPPAAANSANIVTAFDVTKICFAVYVYARTALGIDDQAIQKVSLKDYLNNYVNAYPYITAITIRGFSGEPGQRINGNYTLMAEYDLDNVRQWTGQGVTANTALLTYAQLNWGRHLCVYGSGIEYLDVVTGPASNYPYIPHLMYNNSALGSLTLTHVTDTVWQYATYVGGLTRQALYDRIVRLVNGVCPLFWADSEEDAQSVLGVGCSNPRVHWAQIDGGRLTGNGVYGEQIATDTRAVDWSISVDAPFNNSSYYGVDTNEYVDSIPLTTPAVPVIGQFNKAYVMAFTHVANLASYLWSADSTRIDEILDGLKMYGENPINAIIDLRLYPFNLRALLPDTLPSPEFIKLGRAKSDAIGYPISNPYPVIDLGECEFYRYFGDFRDFPPYTTAELYIPYIGKIPLDPSVFAGHKVSVKLICDIITGAAVAMVYADSIPILYQSGVIGVSVPITGDNAAAYATSVISSVLGKIPTASKIAENVQTGVAAQSRATAAGAVAGAVGMAAGAAADVAGAVFQPTQFQSAGSASPNCAVYQPQQCYITIYQAQSLATAGYGHTSGYACAEYGRIGDFNGYTVFANPDLTGITATGEELTQIAALLAGGIYV